MKGDAVREDKWTLTKRVDQILTGVHYAEEPLSRITHMVSNVQIRSVRPDIDEVVENMEDGQWLQVRYLESPSRASEVGRVELCHATDIVEVLSE